MNVMAEVKITILDGEERGVVHTFTTTGETESKHTEIGIIERLRLEWNHISPYKSIRAGGEDSTCDDCKDPCVMYEKGMKGCNNE